MKDETFEFLIPLGFFSPFNLLWICVYKIAVLDIPSLGLVPWWVWPVILLAGTEIVYWLLPRDYIKDTGERLAVTFFIKAASLSIFSLILLTAILVVGVLWVIVSNFIQVLVALGILGALALFIWLNSLKWAKKGGSR